ncbi:hypothetical protein R69888_07015 [Paraburkholderia haematera]|uniref:Uncharacterized protein n=1 Tax=Paraburkholderia haematera TaxID=2793077 RepID=A0ABN7N3R7_9BURK|nr:hypothetical protein R69888_07015 [Paraburkholderia haematera]
MAVIERSRLFHLPILRDHLGNVTKPLDAIIDPAHDEHQLLLDWCGGSFDPAAFDLQGLNERLFEIKF